MNSIPLPIADSNFSAIRKATATASGDFDWKLRLSYLARPLALRFPSANSGGTTARAVDGAVLFELAAHTGLPAGFDAGVRMGGHLSQWGPAVESNAPSTAPIAQFGAMDPEVEVAWSTPVGAFALRPYLALQLPFGSERALAGESKTRLSFGAVLGQVSEAFQWSLEMGMLYRSPVEFAGTSWNSQLLVGGGALFNINSHWQLGPELRLAPVLGSENSSFQLPAEALLTNRYRESNWNLGVSFGTGLPISSVRNGPDDSTWARAPTTPNYRLICEFGMAL